MASPSAQFELSDYLAVLRRRKTTIALATLGVVAVAVVASLMQTPIYRASADVLLEPRSSQQLVLPSGLRSLSDRTAVQTSIEIMRSRSVQDAVAKKLGFSPSVSIEAVGQTEVVRLSAEDAIPKRAARVVNTYAKVYIQTRRSQLVSDLLEAGAQVQQQISALDRQLDAIDASAVSFDDRIAAATTVEERERLKAEQAADAEKNLANVRTLEAQRAAYTQQLSSLQLAGTSSGAAGAEVVSEATVPGVPVRPTTSRNAAAAAAVGLIFGVGLAFVTDNLDDSIKGKDDLQAATGLSVLGLIPQVPGWRDRAQTRLASVLDPSSPVAEAYRSLRTSVQFMGIDRPVQIIQVTSSSESEGKTTTLANLAIALARAGSRVVVVCCDLRRPRVHEFFDLPNSTGFTSVLVGEVPLREALQTVAAEPRVKLLASGPPPPNPSELLSSNRTRQIFEELRGIADVVLVDAPPVLPVTDALVISGVVDATLLVASVGRATRKSTQRAVEMLNQVDAPLIGAVLNGVEGGRSYGYHYGYRYASKSAPQSRWKRRRDLVGIGTSTKGH